VRCALVIAPDAVRGRDLALRMRERGFRPAIARDASSGVAEARLREPDVVVIDPPDDEPSGALTASAIRGVAPNADLFVVARDPDQPRLLRVVPAPAGPAAAPAAPPAPPARRDGELVITGDLIIDTAGRSATLGGRDAGLTRMEFALLDALALHCGSVLSREEIHQRVWGTPLQSSSRSVDVLVRRLRRKIDEGGGAFTFVQTVPGEGYALRATARAIPA
jgi:two-component system, OmpR family, response regulator